MPTNEHWTLSGAGADGQDILGNVHLPDGDARGVVVIAHGFKGYKDYGMFPRIAQTAAAAGFIAHRFNFSHSGMTNNIDTFERADLFERDTWNKQVFDCRAVIEAITDGRLAGGGLPYVLFGHSRGGVSVLLTAGRFASDSTFTQPAGVVTAAAPSQCLNLPPEAEKQLLEDGYIVSPSSRTGQDLRVGKIYLTEQQEDPQAHDLLAIVSNITCPLLIAHGEIDPTVPVHSAEQIGKAAHDDVKVLKIAGGDHVFNTPNPLPDDQAPSEQFQLLLDELCAFATNCCSK